MTRILMGGAALLLAMGVAVCWMSDSCTCTCSCHSGAPHAPQALAWEDDYEQLGEEPCEPGRTEKPPCCRPHLPVPPSEDAEEQEGQPELLGRGPAQPRRDSGEVRIETLEYRPSDAPLGERERIPF